MRFSPYLLLCILLVGASAASAATEYLIVTTDALAPSFQDLKDHRSAQGYASQILTLEEIQSLATPGRDLAEQIRTAIQAVASGGDLKYVLLGADTDLLPTRFVFNDFYPEGSGTSIPCDLYYAALDGDWDADGDDAFGEVLVDAADLDPELALGRAPVRDAAEASAFVAKQLEYEDAANGSHLNSAIFLDEVLFPSSWQEGEAIQLDGATYGEELRSIISGAPNALADERLYENYTDFPGADPLTKVAATNQLNSANHGLVLHTGHGYTSTLGFGDASFDLSDAAALTNGPHHFVFQSSASACAAFDQDCIVEALIRNPAGGAVAAVASSRTTFPATAQQWMTDIDEEIFQIASPPLGEALRRVRSQRAGGAEANNAERFALLSMTLLGDPLSYVGATAAVVGSPRPVPSSLILLPVEPNPFNPSATIRFELYGNPGDRIPVEIRVYDATGRLLRTLLDETLAPGPQRQEWDGRDGAGIAVRSGVYFASVRTPTQSQSVKMVLLK